ncbi:hypothetical protein ACFLUD_01750 [Chloroflexota bacterium]
MFNVVATWNGIFEALKRRSIYINKIASILGQDLQMAVKDLTKNLEDEVALLDKFLRDDVTGEIDYMIDTLDKMSSHGNTVDSSANKVIEEACKIKTKDIG